MAIGDQVCFHRQLYTDPVNPQRCIAGPVEPVNSINRDAYGAKLLPTTLSAYPVNCVCVFLSLIEDTALLSVP